MHRRSRSAEPLSHARINSDHVASIPGAFLESPIILSSDYDSPEERDAPFRPTETVINDLLDNVRLRNSSSPRPRQPTTPTRPRLAAVRPYGSDPPPRAKRPSPYDRTPIKKPNFTAPCGKEYIRAKCYQKHLMKCPVCEDQLSQSPAQPARQKDNAVTSEDVSDQASSSSRSLVDDGSTVDDAPRVEEDTDIILEKIRAEIRPLPEKQAYEISYDLHVKLKGVMNDRLSVKEKFGIIYFLHVPNKPGIVKLGFSENDYQRGKQHAQKCKLEVRRGGFSVSSAKVKKAEKLLKIDLAHLKTPWYCDHCQQRHDEWFEIKIEQVYRRAEIWKKWIDQVPYEPSGQLKLAWAWFIEDQMLGVFEDFTHEARLAHWKRVLSSNTHAVEEAYMEFQRKHAAGPISSPSISQQVENRSQQVDRRKHAAGAVSLTSTRRRVPLNSEKVTVRPWYYKHGILDMVIVLSVICAFVYFRGVLL